MPQKALTPCNYPGCPELTKDRYCPPHQKHVNKQYEATRETATARGYDSRWRKARLMYLRRHPLCVECKNEDRLSPGTTVDHIVPHKGNQTLFWDENNWQSLCATHHNVKTAKEDGGFGKVNGRT